MKLSINKNNIILYIVLLSMILPTISFFGFKMPVIYLLTPIGLMILSFVLFGWIKIPWITKPLMALWLMILIQILISTFYSTIKKLGYFIFPTDIFQYVVRFVFLISFIVLAYKGRINKNKFIKYFLTILIIGMGIGVLQWIPWTGRELFIYLYPYRDGTEQLSQLNRPLYSLRLHGFTQFATSNGGVASFAAVFAYSVRKYNCKYNKLSVILLILAVINIIASQARAGMLALIFSIFLFYIVNIKYERKSLKPTIKFIGILTALIIITIYLYNNGNEFVIKMFSRWNNLLDTGGGPRATTQPQYFFSLMEVSDYILGLSKPIVNRSALSYGIEVEPLNIFVTYGLTGFLLQYSLVLVLLIYFYKKISKRIEDKAVLTLCIASFVGLFSYQIFSVGYYFFREIRVGLFPWVLLGVAIGIYERYIRENASIN